jgi:hypothetical protein
MEGLEGIKEGIDRNVTEGKLLQIGISMKTCISEIKTSQQARNYYREEGNVLQESFWNGRLVSHKKMFEQLKTAHEKIKKELK